MVIVTPCTLLTFDHVTLMPMPLSVTFLPVTLMTCHSQPYHELTFDTCIPRQTQATVGSEVKKLPAARGCGCLQAGHHETSQTASQGTSTEGWGSSGVGRGLVFYPDPATQAINIDDDEAATCRKRRACLRRDPIPGHPALTVLAMSGAP